MAHRLNPKDLEQKIIKSQMRIGQSIYQTRQWILIKTDSSYYCAKQCLDKNKLSLTKHQFDFDANIQGTGGSKFSSLKDESRKQGIKMKNIITWMTQWGSMKTKVFNFVKYLFQKVKNVNSQLKNGANIGYTCLCSQAYNKKIFWKNLDINEAWNIPQILRQAVCPHCLGNGKQGKTKIIKLVYFNCKWTLQTQLQGSDDVFKVTEEATELNQNINQIKDHYFDIFEYLIIKCQPLK